MTLYDFLIPLYTENLKKMDAILAKAEDFMKEKKVTDEVILNTRLAVDMFPFSRQVQSMSDAAKGGAAAICNKQAPKMEDNEKTIAELRTRVQKTIEYIGTLTPELADEATLNERKVPLWWMPGKGLTAYGYVTHYSFHNFFFHYTTAYDILRHLGLTIGKADYMGTLPFVDVA